MFPPYQFPHRPPVSSSLQDLDPPNPQLIRDRTVRRCCAVIETALDRVFQCPDCGGREFPCCGPHGVGSEQDARGTNSHGRGVYQGRTGGPPGSACDPVGVPRLTGHPGLTNFRNVSGVDD